jgi:putative component of membrane protein insertase Oxa1/YidC/SpoIIIJ protein YidD
MKWIILKCIELYWTFVPDSLKGVCLFRESCSRYVYRTLKDDGMEQVYRAFTYRLHVCRKPFSITRDQLAERTVMHLCNGDCVDEMSINPYLLTKSKPPLHT